MNLKKLSLESKKFVLVHPAGNPELTPSPEMFVDIIRTLQETHSLPIVLSQGPTARDRWWTENILKAIALPVLGPLDLLVFAEVLRHAKLVVAPGTGPIHLAHYVSTPTIVIHSDIRSDFVRRWTPWGSLGRSNYVVTPSSLTMLRYSNAT